MPKKTKRGGGGKGGGKTEEERLVFQQQRAQAEEEMAKKKEEILTLFLKDKLQKEERNTAVNQLKLNESWRSVLRQTRAAELRRDVAVLNQTFERQLDRLNSVIKNTELNQQGAERQSAQVQRIHLQHVERLCAQHEEQVTFLQQQWSQSQRHLSAMFSSERKQILGHSEQQRDDREDAMFAMEQQHQEEMNEIHRMYGETIASYESAHVEKMNALALENKQRLKEKMLENQEILQLVDKATKELDALVSKKQLHIEMREREAKKIKELQDQAVHMRVKLNAIMAENELLEQNLTAARNELNRETHKLRDELMDSQAAARKDLTDLTEQSGSATKNLQAVVSEGERVSRVAEMCWKLESEQESVFTSSSAEAAHDPRSVTEKEEPAQETLEFPEMQQVTRRISVALLHRGALKKQNEDLSRENRQLRLLLRQHLDAMTVSDHTLDGRHALLTVYRAPTTTAPPDTDRRHTVIEAVHVVQQSL